MSSPPQEVDDVAIRNVMSFHLFLWGVNTTAFLYSLYSAVPRCSGEETEASEMIGDLSPPPSPAGNAVFPARVPRFGCFSNFPEFLVVLLFLFYSINSVGILFITDYFVGSSFDLDCVLTFQVIGISYIVGRIVDLYSYINRINLVFAGVEDESLGVQNISRYLQIMLAVYAVGFLGLGIASGASEITTSRSRSGAFRVCTSRTSSPTIGMIAALYNVVCTIALYFVLTRSFVSRLNKLEGDKVENLTRFKTLTGFVLGGGVVAQSAVAVFVRNDLMHIVPVNYYLFLVSFLSAGAQWMTANNKWLMKQQWKIEMAAGKVKDAE